MTAALNLIKTLSRAGVGQAADEQGCNEMLDLPFSPE